MNKDQVKGRGKEVQGEAKKVTGRVFADKSLEQKGSTQKIIGKEQVRHGGAKSDAKNDR